MVGQKNRTTSSFQVWCEWEMPLFDNAFNFNVNNVRVIQILLVKFTCWPTAGPKCSGNRDHKMWPFLAIHTKLPAFKTVLAKTSSWNWVLHSPDLSHAVVTPLDKSPSCQSHARQFSRNLKALFNNVFTLKIWAAWPYMLSVSLVRCKNEALKMCTSKASLSASKEWK